MSLVLFITYFSLILFLLSRLESTAIIDDTSILFSGTLQLIYDPPDGHFSPTALGVYVYASETAKIYYELNTLSENYIYPTLSSNYSTYASPYIMIDTPYLYPRNRTITIVAVDYDQVLGTIRSEQYTIQYYVEASARPYSYGFLVPGIETSGYFLRVGLEEVATARAQASNFQEFADFFTYLGLGTYAKQIQAVHLPSIDTDLTGFEGGLAVNTSNGGQYGILFPYHNGKRFFGKVIRIDLYQMANATRCFESYKFESYDNNYNVNITESTVNYTNPCIHVIDLSTIHPNARGFRKGFVGYPYVYLSPGEYNVLVRLNMENFTIDTVKIIDLQYVDITLGGYSGGFVDGTWACYNPYRTFYGPVGGLRSNLPVDSNRLQAYFHGRMLCVNQTGWDHEIFEILNNTKKLTKNSITSLDYRTFTPSNISPDYRGFSDAIRVGRYAYLCPYANDNHVYTGKIVRIYLGTSDIGTLIDSLNSTNTAISTVVDVLDLTQVNANYSGFTCIFNAGQYLYLVPYRNANILYNGQRGHGNFVKLDMNNYELSGVTGIDMTTVTRNQIPSFADTNLRGFSYGFASGKYGVLVPFYCGVFSGKSARMTIFGTGVTLDSNLQELDFTIDRVRSNVYKGFRGGFVGLWQGVLR